MIADEGIDGLVVKLALRGIDTREAHGVVELTAAAGEPWDELVRLCVEHGWAGLECLSGIPGLVGATPMQNVGAYGQEVSETVILVRALDTCSGRIMTFENRECRFGYSEQHVQGAMRPDGMSSSRSPIGYGRAAARPCGTRTSRTIWPRGASRSRPSSTSAPA